MVFVSAKEGPPNYGPKEPYIVQYFDEHGNMSIKSGGTKTWRNNNVGNLVVTHSESHNLFDIVLPNLRTYVNRL